jgi:hypothetical protein
MVTQLPIGQPHLVLGPLVNPNQGILTVPPDQP